MLRNMVHTGMNDELFGQGTERGIVVELQKRGYEVVCGGGYHRTQKRDTLPWRNPGTHTEFMSMCD